MEESEQCRSKRATCTVKPEYGAATVSVVSQEADVVYVYRPLSLVIHFAKIIEKFIQKQIMVYLDDHAFITVDQSAYLKRHSTQTSLHRLIDEILENINNNAITGLCFLDIQTCFDTNNHTILLDKLTHYGIRIAELKWFQSAECK